MYVGAENNEAIHFFEQSQFITADPVEGRIVGGTFSIVMSAASFQEGRSLSAFFQAIIFRTTGDFDQPIKLLETPLSLIVSSSLTWGEIFLTLT